MFKDPSKMTDEEFERSALTSSYLKKLIDQLTNRVEALERDKRSTIVQEHRIVVYDLGPDDPAERKKWDKENGGGVVHLTTHQRDIVELGKGRYVQELPAGMPVTRRVVHS
jgi:hypothetical protein